MNLLLSLISLVFFKSFFHTCLHSFPTWWNYHFKSYASYFDYCATCLSDSVYFPSHAILHPWLGCSLFCYDHIANSNPILFQFPYYFKSHAISNPMLYIQSQAIPLSEPYSIPSFVSFHILFHVCRLRIRPISNVVLFLMSCSFQSHAISNANQTISNAVLILECHVCYFRSHANNTNAVLFPSSCYSYLYLYKFRNYLSNCTWLLPFIQQWTTHVEILTQGAVDWFPGTSETTPNPALYDKPV